MLNCPKTNPDVMFRKEGEETFLFYSQACRIKVLNAVGAFIWQLCDGKYSEGEIAQKIQENFYGCIQREVKEDLQNLLNILKKDNFIT